MLGRFLLIALLATAATALNLPGVPVDFTEDNEVISAISNEIAEKFSIEYVKYIRTGVESASLKQITNQLSNSISKKDKRDLFITPLVDTSSIVQFFTCTSCRAVMNVLIRMFRSEDGELSGDNAFDDSKMAVLKLCNRFDIQTQEVCDGLVDLNFDIIHYIIMNTDADARSICGSLPIPICEAKHPAYNWNVNIDGSKPAMIGPKSDVPKKTANDLNIVQITDIHYDPEYSVGSLADCPEPMCCRYTPPSGISDEAKAGYWSDWNCDLPKHTITNAFAEIKKNNEKIDYIYQTGDMVPHNVWSTTKEGNKDTLTELNGMVADAFPGIPVYPCVGNHEPHPTNVFGSENVPEQFSISWLYEHLWSEWQRWLPAETKDTILKGGYYTVSPKPGFRIISMNAMDCYIFNWWIFFDGSATSQPQLDWLHDTLLAAEKANEFVHILVHIPSGDSDCWTVWAREYNRILERFSSTISGIFNGHTHVDELNVHYSAEGHAMAVSWNGGSLTTYTNKNPNYKVYEVEPATYQVVDYHTWIFNLTEANEHGDHREPIWFEEYKFTEFTDDLSPAGVDALLNQMAENPNLLRKYWKYKHTSADPKLARGCNDSCLSKLICRMATSVYDEKARCKELKETLKNALANEGENNTTTTPSPTTPGDDGAASLTASITLIVALLYLVKQFLL